MAGQYIELDERFLEYRFWRVDGAVHKIAPKEGYTTDLDLALVQGAYVPSPRNFFRSFTAAVEKIDEDRKPNEPLDVTDVNAGSSVPKWIRYLVPGL